MAVLCHLCATWAGLGHLHQAEGCCSAREMLSGAALGIRRQAKHRGTSAVSDLKARNHLCRQLKQVAVRKHAHLSLQCSKTKASAKPHIYSNIGCSQQPAAEFVPYTLAILCLETARPRWWWDLCPHLKLPSSHQQSPVPPGLHTQTYMHVHISEGQNFPNHKKKRVLQWLEPGFSSPAHPPQTQCVRSALLLSLLPITTAEK